MATTKKSSTRKTARKSIHPVNSFASLTRSTNKRTLDQDTWVVFRSSSSERKPLLFDGRFTRDQVRTAYARETGVHHDRTRSRRLRNY